MHVTHLRKKFLILGAVCIVVLAIGIIAGAMRASSGEPHVDYFDLENHSFVAESHHVQRMEVWAVPEGAKSETQWRSLGLMEKASHWGSWARWQLAVPPKSDDFMQIMVRGYDGSNTEVDRVSLPWIGNKVLMKAVWGNL